MTIAEQPAKASVHEEHQHCYHPYVGPPLVVVPEGEIPQRCCGCDAMRTIEKKLAMKR